MQDVLGEAHTMDEEERKVVNEFCHLLEKSKQLFNGLRDMPQYGHKQWQAYFGRTFDIYTKLWKFQQQHRAILDRWENYFSQTCCLNPSGCWKSFNKLYLQESFNGLTFRGEDKSCNNFLKLVHFIIISRKYGLKRWQIGEIASKIGQLYYHY